MKQSQNTLNEWTVFESRLQATIVNYMKKLWNSKKSHITSDAKIFVGLNLTFKKVFNKKIKTNKWVLTHWSTNLMVKRSFNPAFRSERGISLRLSKSYILSTYQLSYKKYFIQIMYIMYMKKIHESNMKLWGHQTVRLKSKWQRINTINLYLRDISTPLVGVVFKHRD